MKGSINASYIIRDYKLEQFYKKQKRQHCQIKNCNECKFEKICDDRETNSEK